MKCEKCNSSWDSSVPINKCPFCGEAINQENIPVTDITSAIKKIISEYSIDIFDSPQKVVSLVNDYLPEGFHRERKLLRIACSNKALKHIVDIVNESNEEQQKILIKKLNSLLIDEAFLSDENAALILNILLNAVVVKVNHHVEVQYNDHHNVTLDPIHTVQESGLDRHEQNTQAVCVNDYVNMPYEDLPMYKEKIRRGFHAEGKVKSSIPGYEEYAVVNIKFEPSSNEKNEFVNNDTQTTIPKGMISAIEKGLNSTFEKGPLAGYSVVGVKAILTSGSYHPIASNAKAFEKAAQIAYNENFEKGAPILLEKIINVRVALSEDLEQMDAIMKKILEFRGRVMGLGSLSDYELNFEIPASELDNIEHFMKEQSEKNIVKEVTFARYDDFCGPAADKIIRQNKGN